MTAHERYKRSTEIEDVIKPIIFETFGDNGMTRAFVVYLTERIVENDYDSRGREYMIMLACWDWFTGGTTAASTAKKIEAVL